ncbi:MAG: DUF4394 domain-containing protein [Acidobacteriota bacterium]|nr:DUF4394 domain-containing protein [Acidobacteriota bacterium]
MKKQFLALAVAAAGLFGVAQQAKAEPITVLSTQTGTILSQQIATFDSALPGTFGSNVTVTGLLAGDRLVGIDRRPVNGLIYGVAQNGTVGRIYTINATTGAATLVSTLSEPLNGTNFGVDFNPVVDRLRVVSNLDQNLRINVDTGVTLVDGTLAYAAGDPNQGANPNITAVAYSNNFAGASTTVLRDVDASLDIVAIQNPPNDGTLNTALAFGFNATEIGAYDISGLTGTPYFAFVDASGNFSNLYFFSMEGLTLIGRIGNVNGFLVDGLAAPVGAPIPEPTTMLLLGTGLAGVAARVRQRRKTNS